jgi:hypothetical protein
MDYYQTIVSEWLTSDGRTLVAQEYGLRTSHVNEFRHKEQSNLWPDILAVRLNDKQVFLCEVTWSKDWGRIKEKMCVYDVHMPQIRLSLENWLGIPATDDWKLDVWYFVPKVHIEKIVQRKPQELRLRLTPLELIKPWTYTHGWREWNDHCTVAP